MRAWLLIAILLLTGVVGAAEPAVPSPLDAWRGWVMKGQEFRACPLIAGRNAAAVGDFLCAWPGVLRLDADAQGATIAQRWRLDAEGWVPLPGDARYWPQQVTINGQPAVVIDRGGPTVWLAAGTHDLRARIAWDERPQALPVPGTIALVALSVDGKPVAPVQREGNAVTLGRVAGGPVEADSVDLQVFRRFTDAIPGELTTEIHIDASGQAREEVFGPVLPEGFVPLALDSEEWPARLDERGLLHVQVQPGSDTLTLTARATASMTKLVARLPAEGWPEQEIWSYAAQPRLRATGVSGALQVDPRQADVPDEWQALPAFVLEDGGELTIEERSRGNADDESNRLTLQREAWLDFSGDGWFARDRISGRMQAGWRFDMAPPYALQRAESGIAGTDAESLLVTRGAVDGTSGVEWRTPQVDLRAGVRVADDGSALPVAGWQQVFDQVTTTLHLPYGHRLIAAPGSDRANGSWLSRWTLLDVFLLAIITLLGLRLFGVPGAIASALYLVLGWQEFGAPLWSLLAVYAIALVVRALPVGRLARASAWLRLALVIVFVFVALPFAAQQVRLALYPQLEGGARQASEAFVFDANVAMQQMPAPAAPPPPPMVAEAPADDRDHYAESKSLESVVVTGSRVRRADLQRNVDQIRKYSQSTVMQTGAGEPGWRLGNAYTLNWSGPVMPAQDVDLVIARPWLVRTLRVVLVALLAWLLWRVVRLTASAWPPRTTAPAAHTAAALLVVMLAATPPAGAQSLPPDGLLEQLRVRLTEAPRCVPACASIAAAEVDARADEVRIALDVHAAERVAVPLPHDDVAAVLRSVTIDGSASDALVRVGNVPWMAVPRGVHRVELVFTAAADKIDLAFAMPPRRIAFNGDSWQASGIAEQRLLAETLTLVRARAGADQRPLAVAQQFPPFVRVVRDIDLDLDWRVETTVERLAPREGGFTVELPILAGERVSTPGLRVRDGKLTLAIPTRAEAASWSATLDPATTLTLTAPALSEHAEVWRFLVSPTWHVEFSGVPETGDGSTGDDYRRFEFHPLPGETLTLAISKPIAVEGATRAIDKVDVVSDFGQRASSHVLRFNLRASQGGEQVVTLPVGVEVIGVEIDGSAMPTRALDGKLSLPVHPGMQAVAIRFRDNAAMSWRATTPVLDLGLPAANIDLRANLPDTRWLLAAFGPPVGPAVLFWGELLAMIALALLLSRWRHSPLRFHHWLLLGLGFSTFSWIALGIVVAWIVALDWRRRADTGNYWRFNLVQLGLVALTFVALCCLVASIHNGLLGEPDMVVSGSESSARNLHWFADRSDAVLPTAGVVSLPLWVYNLVMLAWALWLAWAVVGWLRRGFAAWSRDGYWKPWSAPTPKAAIDVPVPAPPPPA